MEADHPGASSPAGTPVEPGAIDRPWRIWAATAVAGALALAALLGFLIVPAVQRKSADISLYQAICRAAGLQPGSPARAQPVAPSGGSPVSEVSWDPQIMHVLTAPPTGRGAALAAQTCAACHGEKGISQTNVIPSLAGQSSYAIYKQLSDYRSGARAHPQMTPVAKALEVRDLAEVATFFASAASTYTALGSRDYSGSPNIEKLAREGDSHRRLPACLSCHVNNAGGPIETPVLNGQNREYMIAQLEAYAMGRRRNDVYGRMRDIAVRLTPAERAELARFFEGTI